MHTSLVNSVDTRLVTHDLLLIDFNAEELDKFANAFRKLWLLHFLTFKSDHTAEDFCHDSDEVILIALLPVKEPQ